MLKKPFSALLCSVMLLQGYSSPVLAAQDEEAMEETSEMTETENSSVQEVLENDELPLDTAVSIPVNTNKIGSLKERDSVNWYSFDVDSAGYISLDFNHSYIEDGDSYWKIEIYNSSMDELLFMASSGDKIKTTSCNVGIPAGRYYVKIYRGWDHSDTSYTFKVSFNSSSTWEKELNDTYETSNSIPLNTSIKGTLASRDDADWYNFTLSSVGYVSLDFTHQYIEDSDSYWKVELYNEDFEKESYFAIKGNETAYTDAKIGLDKGKYHIKVYKGWDQDDMDYTFKVNFKATSSWEIEPNDSAKTATPLTLRATKIGVLENSDDCDWYSIDLSDGDYTLWFTPSTVVSSNNWKVEVYNSALTDKIEHQFAKNDTSWDFRIADGEPGKYYIQVKRTYDHLREDYSIAVTKVGESRPSLSVDPTPDPEPDPTPQVEGNSMYRLYNPNSGEHHYTADSKEKATLLKLGWKDEGDAWYAPTYSSTPVYRLYNKNSGDHHYTTDKNEKDTLVRLGWNYEDIGWYSDDAKGVAIYRQYNPNAKEAGSHNYTANREEERNLVNLGWRAEGIAWYGVASSK